MLLYVQEPADLLGDLAWVAPGVLAILALGWKPFNYFRAAAATSPHDPDAQERPYSRASQT